MQRDHAGPDYPPDDDAPDDGDYAPDDGADAARLDSGREPPGHQRRHHHHHHLQQHQQDLYHHNHLPPPSHHHHDAYHPGNHGPQEYERQPFRRPSQQDQPHQHRPYSSGRQQQQQQQPQQQPPSPQGYAAPPADYGGGPPAPQQQLYMQQAQYPQQPLYSQHPYPAEDSQFPPDDRGYYDPRRQPRNQHHPPHPHHHQQQQFQQQQFQQQQFQQQQQQQQQPPPGGAYYDPRASDPAMYDRYPQDLYEPPQQNYDGVPAQRRGYSADWDGAGQQYNGNQDVLYYQQQPLPQHQQALHYQHPIMTDMSGPSRAVSYMSAASALPLPEPQPSAAAQATQESIEEHRKAAKQSNDPLLQFEFAKFLIEVAATAPDSVPDDPKASRKYKEGLLSEGLKWIKRLASQGIGLGRTAYPEAQFFLANCYGNGSLGLPVDHDKAFTLYVQASKQSHASATYRTAVCYELGAGTKRDHARAVQFYRKAAALGDTAAMYKFGMILLNGLLGQQKNPREAITWLKRASAVADEENPHALHELGLCYEKAGIPNLIPDESYSRELFTKAAQLGYAPSQFKMGCCYEYGTLTCPVDPRRSIYWYTRAAEQADPESELALSGWYLTGSEGVLKQSDTEAYLWARKAADKCLAKAEYAVGYYSEVGIGVKQDVDEAKRWYMRAAAQGNKRAMQRLTDLKRMGSESRRVKPEKHTRGQDGDCIIS